MYYLVTNLEVKVTGFRVEPQVNAVAVVTDDVLSSRVLAVPSTHELLKSGGLKEPVIDHKIKYVSQNSVPKLLQQLWR